MTYYLNDRTLSPTFYEDDRDYYMDCGCWSGQADHTCMGGRRPSYCHCGAPDDCYCPSPSERWTERLDGTEMPAMLHIDYYGTPGRRKGTVTWMVYDLDHLIDLILDQDPDDADMTLIDANEDKVKL